MMDIKLNRKKQDRADYMLEMQHINEQMKYYVEKVKESIAATTSVSSLVHLMSINDMEVKKLKKMNLAGKEDAQVTAKFDYIDEKLSKIKEGIKKKFKENFESYNHMQETEVELAYMDSQMDRVLHEYIQSNQKGNIEDNL